MYTKAVFFILSVFFISQDRSQAQQVHDHFIWAGTSIGWTEQGASTDQLKEFEDIISRYKTKTGEWALEEIKNMPSKDRQRLEQLFQKMSRKQQGELKIAFLRGPKPLPKMIPSEKSFEQWKKPNEYGVWIDNKKVANQSLDNYKNTDFEQFVVSRLYGAAKKGKTYNYQVNLMTKAYYEKYLREHKNRESTRLVVRR
jgi:bla regulator protein BlaR1